MLLEKQRTDDGTLSADVLTGWNERLPCVYQGSGRQVGVILILPLLLEQMTSSFVALFPFETKQTLVRWN